MGAVVVTIVAIVIIGLLLYFARDAGEECPSYIKMSAGGYDPDHMDAIALARLGLPPFSPQKQQPTSE